MEQEHNKEQIPSMDSKADKRCTFSVLGGAKYQRRCHLSYKTTLKELLFITCNGTLEEKKACPFWNKLMGDL